MPAKLLFNSIYSSRSLGLHRMAVNVKPETEERAEITHTHTGVVQSILLQFFRKTIQNSAATVTIVALCELQSFTWYSKVLILIFFFFFYLRLYSKFLVNDEFWVIELLKI